VLTEPPSFRFRLEPGVRYLVNPGSIGQPRDGIPLASFATFDSDTHTVAIHRVQYPLERAQRKILGAGLPGRSPTASPSGADLRLLVRAPGRRPRGAAA